MNGLPRARAMREYVVATVRDDVRADVRTTSTLFNPAEAPVRAAHGARSELLGRDDPDPVLEGKKAKTWGCGMVTSEPGTGGKRTRFKGREMGLVRHLDAAAPTSCWLDGRRGQLLTSAFGFLQTAFEKADGEGDGALATGGEKGRDASNVSEHGPPDEGH